MSCAAVLLVRLPPPLPALHPGKRGGYNAPHPSCWRPGARGGFPRERVARDRGSRSRLRADRPRATVPVTPHQLRIRQPAQPGQTGQGSAHARHLGARNGCAFPCVRVALRVALLRVDLHTISDTSFDVDIFICGAAVVVTDATPHSIARARTAALHRACTGREVRACAASAPPHVASSWRWACVASALGVDSPDW